MKLVIVTEGPLGRGYEEVEAVVFGKWAAHAGRDRITGWCVSGKCGRRISVSMSMNQAVHLAVRLDADPALADFPVGLEDTATEKLAPWGATIMRHVMDVIGGGTMAVEP